MQTQFIQQRVFETRGQKVMLVPMAIGIGLREKIGTHDAQLNQIYEALENMLDKKVEEENEVEAWKYRKRIGFKKLVQNKKLLL